MYKMTVRFEKRTRQGLHTYRRRDNKQKQKLNSTNVRWYERVRWDTYLPESVKTRRFKGRILGAKPPCLASKNAEDHIQGERAFRNRLWKLVAPDRILRAWFVDGYPAVHLLRRAI